MDSSTNHYETLGVPRTATPDAIKRAYRKKASKAHPDKGGSGDDMAQLNRALAVLEDPAWRGEYDHTGRDAGPTIEERAHATMLSMFQQALQATDENVVAVISRAIAGKKQEMLTAKHDVQAKCERLVKRRGKIKTKGGVENMAHRVIDQHLGVLDAELQQIADVSRVMDLCSQLLKAYTDEAPSPADDRRAAVFGFLATGTI